MNDEWTLLNLVRIIAGLALGVPAVVFGAMSGYEYNYLSDPTWFEDTIIALVLAGGMWLVWPGGWKQ